MKKLEISRSGFTQEERLNLEANRGEILLGYQLIKPVSLGFNASGKTGENMQEVLEKLNAQELLSHSARKYDHRPVQAPALIVPVFLSKHAPASFDFTSWCLRTFTVQLVYEFERTHWWQPKRLTQKDQLRLVPQISQEVCLEETPPYDGQRMIAYWEDLHQKELTLEQLRIALGLESKTA